MAHSCRRCNRNPVNPGYSWCTQCYQISTGSIQQSIPTCVNCKQNPANFGYNRCEQCYRISIGLAQQSIQTCTNCNRNPANPGYKWCDPCFQQACVPKITVQKSPCARLSCPCKSFNGQAGHFCCRTCQNGTPCVKAYHM